MWSRGSGALIEHTCPSPPALVGHGLGGAIAARFAIAHPDRLSGLVLVDAFGLDRFEPAPSFGLALHRFMEQPTEHTRDGLFRQCFVDLDGLRQQLGQRWEPLAAYALDRARTPGQQAALGSLMPRAGAAGDPAGGPGTDRGSHHPDLGAARPPGAAAGRRGGQRPPRLAAARDRGRRRRPRARAAQSVPAHAPRRAGHLDRRGGPQMTTTTIDIAGLDGGHVNLTAEQLDDLDSQARRSAATRRRRRLGRRAAGLERHGGQGPRAHRPAGLGPRRGRGGWVRPRPRAAAQHQGRRPQHRRHRHRRTRPDPRPVPHAPHHASTPTPGSPTSDPAACSRTSTRRPRSTGWPPCSASSPRSAWPA